MATEESPRVLSRDGGRRAPILTCNSGVFVIAPVEPAANPIRTVGVWDAMENRLLWSTSCELGMAYHHCLASNKFVALCGPSDVSRKTLRVWDMLKANGEEAWVAEGLSYTDAEMESNSLGDKLLVCERGWFDIWSLEAGVELFRVDGTEFRACFVGDGSRVLFKGDMVGTQMWFDGEESQFHVWDTIEAVHLYSFPASCEYEVGITCSPDGRLFAPVKSFSEFSVYDISTGEKMLCSALPGYSRICFSPDGATIAAFAELGHHLTLWNIVDGTVALSVRLSLPSCFEVGRFLVCHPLKGTYHVCLKRSSSCRVVELDRNTGAELSRSEVLENVMGLYVVAPTIVLM
jgi:hypothetical protein